MACGFASSTDFGLLCREMPPTHTSPISKASGYKKSAEAPLLKNVDEEDIWQLVLVMQGGTNHN